jgi:hypothetical protein
MKVCIECGKENPDTSLFCKYCGAKLPESIMKMCPDCGKENPETSRFCKYCGAELTKPTYEPRMKVTDNIKYAFNITTSNLKIFYPTLIMVGAMIGFGVIFLITTMLAFIVPSSNASNSTFEFIGIIFAFIVLLAEILVMVYFAIVSVPAFQDVYKSAVTKTKIELRRSFNYGKSRFVSYLVATILFMVVGFILMFALSIPYLSKFFEIASSSTLPPEQILQSMWWYGVPMALIIIPYEAASYLAMWIMAWEDVDIGPAIKLGSVYIKKRWKDLLVILVIVAASYVLMIIPILGFIITYAIMVVLNLAVIDNYLSYKTTLNQEP